MDRFLWGIFSRCARTHKTGLTALQRAVARDVNCTNCTIGGRDFKPSQDIPSQKTLTRVSNDLTAQILSVVRFFHAGLRQRGWGSRCSSPTACLGSAGTFQTEFVFISFSCASQKKHMWWCKRWKAGRSVSAFRDSLRKPVSLAGTPQKTPPFQAVRSLQESRNSQTLPGHTLERRVINY